MKAIGSIYYENYVSNCTSTRCKIDLENFSRNEQWPRNLFRIDNVCYFDVCSQIPGMVPYTKRPAQEKSGIPAVYQPNASNYQQLMHVQQPFVPVSCEYHHQMRHSDWTDDNENPMSEQMKRAKLRLNQILIPLMAFFISHIST